MMRTLNRAGTRGHPDRSMEMNLNPQWRVPGRRSSARSGPAMFMERSASRSEQGDEEHSFRVSNARKLVFLCIQSDNITIFSGLDPTKNEGSNNWVQQTSYKESDRNFRITASQIST
jgi:hypothetical protein